jgi:RNA polymerase sigma-70 factor (ECF subfamily)
LFGFLLELSLNNTRELMQFRELIGSPMTADVATIVQTLMQQRDSLFAYIWTIVRDVQLAEDTLQELSILAVRKGCEIEDPSRLPAWLRRSARLKALELLRDRGRNPAILSDAVLDQLEGYWSERDSVATTDAAEALRNCLGKISDSNRRILVMRYVEDRKTGDIAQILGRKVDVVYTTLSRIHTALRKCVKARLEEARS